MLQKIASFTINHDVLVPGMYISRIDGNDITYDLRLKTPNRGDYLAQGALHTIEHLGATFLRNDPEWSDKVVYFGPMGCRTGFYMLLAGDLTSRDVVDLVTRMYEFIRDFQGDIPGASARDCGNYLDQNLPMANWLAKRYLDNTLYNITENHLVYPE